MTDSRPSVVQAGAECERALRRLKRFFRDEVRLTIIARHPTESDCHIIVSAEADNLCAVADALILEARKGDEP